MSTVAIAATTAMAMNPIQDPNPSKKYSVTNVLTAAATPLADGDALS